ncbi:hypothetical protein BDP27DRAFT_1427010 [Rhodocollybia butyracea]|uniref:N-acetyltransferase domain-containing protein n=1 Tax=Rhodocollybia butyracea TaxID=206335 RepID=A0A9P5PIL1_9AGAR|nr:hypothetical protein BDP27DRAFT_1427010 [Rhodocollybia butyracea]
MSSHANELLLRFKQITVEQTLPLRHQVLWPELSIEKVKLPEDANGWHFGAFVDDPMTKDNNGPIAVISLFLDPIPIDDTSVISRDISDSLSSPPTPAQNARFRKFACKTSMQGRGIGTALLRYTMDFARSNLNAGVLWCDARVSSAEWYERRGLLQFGNTFYKGPVQYVRMKTEL